MALMMPPPRHSWHALLAGAALLMLVVAVVWWFADADAPETIGDATSLAQSKQTLSTARSSSLSDPPIATTPKSILQTATAEERREISVHLEAAKALLREIEKAASIPGKIVENELRRAESVQIPPLTVEQLQPVYTLLSNANRDFSIGSAAAQEFRRQADGFIRSIQRRPGKYVSRAISKDTGAASYKLIRLSEGAIVTELENGGVRVEGPNSVRLGVGLNEELGYLFPPFEKP